MGGALVLVELEDVEMIIGPGGGDEGEGGKLEEGDIELGGMIVGISVSVVEVLDTPGGGGGGVLEIEDMRPVEDWDGMVVDVDDGGRGGAEVEAEAEDTGEVEIGAVIVEVDVVDVADGDDEVDVALAIVAMEVVLDAVLLLEVIEDTGVELIVEGLEDEDVEEDDEIGKVVAAEVLEETLTLLEAEVMLDVVDVEDIDVVLEVGVVLHRADVEDVDVVLETGIVLDIIAVIDVEAVLDWTEVLEDEVADVEVVEIETVLLSPPMAMHAYLELSMVYPSGQAQSVLAILSVGVSQRRSFRSQSPLTWLEICRCRAYQSQKGYPKLSCAH